MPKVIKITLTEDEMYLAVSVGTRRQLHSLFHAGDKPHFVPAMGEWEKAIQSCGAELAVAKHLGLYWDGVTMFSGDDIKNIGVRWSTTNSLYIYKKDDPESKYILVQGTGPNYLIQGWCPGVSADKRGTWNDKLRMACWDVPIGNLRDLNE